MAQQQMKRFRRSGKLRFQDAVGNQSLFQREAKYLRTGATLMREGPGAVVSLVMGATRMDKQDTCMSNSQSYHIQARLANSQPAVLVDPGSFGNLCGDRWAKEVAQHATRNQRTPTYTKRNRPLKV